MTTEITPSEEVNQAVVTIVDDQFTAAKAGIDWMKTEAGKLSIAGPEDKVGFNSVYGLRQTVKKQRVAVEKRARELKAPHIAYNRQVDSILKELTEPMNDIEDSLAQQEKAYNDERERIAEEKALAARVRYQNRTDALRALGFVYDPVLDTFGFGEYLINVDDIRDLSDEDYEPSLYGAQMVYRLEQDRLAEIKYQQEQEAQRLAEQQRIETERLAAERKQLEEQQAELKRQQDALLAQQKQLKDEQDQATINSRVTRLLNAGWVEEEFGLYSRPNTQLRRANILAFTDELFDQVISETVAYFERREAERLQSIQDEAENLRIRTDAEKAKKKADKARQARLKPDKKTIGIFLRKIPLLPFPQLNDLQPETKSFFAEFDQKLNRLVNDYKEQLEQL